MQSSEVLEKFKTFNQQLASISAELYRDHIDISEAEAGLIVDECLQVQRQLQPFLFKVNSYRK